MVCAVCDRKLRNERVHATWKKPQETEFLFDFFSCGADKKNRGSLFSQIVHSGGSVGLKVPPSFMVQL